MTKEKWASTSNPPSPSGKKKRGKKPAREKGGEKGQAGPWVRETHRGTSNSGKKEKESHFVHKKCRGKKERRRAAVGKFSKNQDGSRRKGGERKRKKTNWRWRSIIGVGERRGKSSRALS